MGSVLGRNTYATAALGVTSGEEDQKTYGTTASSGGDLDLRVELGGGKAFTFTSSNGSHDIAHWQKDNPGIRTLSTFRLQDVDAVGREPLKGTDLFTVLSLDPDAPFRAPGANFLSDICHGIWADVPGCKEVSADDHEVLWYLRRTC